MSAAEVLIFDNFSIGPEFIGEEPGKRHFTSGAAFRIAHEKTFRTIGWKPEVGMEEGLRRLTAWRESNEGKTS
jgi:nucleoside-diphosphate-sugar epimerase